jgi:hypothetical protein
MSDDLKDKLTSQLDEQQCYIWEYNKSCKILIARTGATSLVSMPVEPSTFFALPSSDQATIQTWLESFTMFSPATKGEMFTMMYETVDLS